MPGSWWTRSYKRQHTRKPSVSEFPRFFSWHNNLTRLLDIGLQVLDNVIITKWKVLPRDQCQGKVATIHLIPPI